MHESDDDRHLVAGAGDPTSPRPDDTNDLDGPGEHGDQADRRRDLGDAPPSPDLVQAVADFLDDLVDATADNGPDAPGQGGAGAGGGGETDGASPDADAHGGLGIDIATIAGAHGGLAPAIRSAAWPTRGSSVATATGARSCAAAAVTGRPTTVTPSERGRDLTTRVDQLAT